MVQSRPVAAYRGVRWIGEGFALFKKSAAMWLMITASLFAAFKIILLIPFIGVIAILAMPIVLVGLMEGCRAVDMGQPLKPTYLLSGFVRNTAALAVLGAIYLIGNLLILLIIVKIGGESLMQVLKFTAEQKATPRR